MTPYRDQKPPPAWKPKGLPWWWYAILFGALIVLGLCRGFMAVEMSR